jgi:hypothetical protein
MKVQNGSRGLSPQPGEGGFAGGGLSLFGTFWHDLALFYAVFGRAPGIRLRLTSARQVGVTWGNSVENRSENELVGPISRSEWESKMTKDDQT